MENSGSYKTDNLMKYGIIIMTVAAFAAMVVMPPLANAECEHGHWDKSKRIEFMEKRQNALHDKLGLSASQEAAWNDFVAKSKSNENWPNPDWSELSNLSTPDRLDHMLAMMKERQQAMESHAEVVKAFYAQLTPAQKRIFDESFAFHKIEHERHSMKNADVPRLVAA
jgi:Spy/CpxP family protein refolding chaperone